MINKVVDDLLALSMADPQNMSRTAIDNVRCVLVVVMQLEFVNHDEICIRLRLSETQRVTFLPFITFRIDPAEPLLIDVLYGVLGQSRQTGNLLIRISEGQQIFRITFKSLCDPVMLCSERYFFHMCFSAHGAQVLPTRKTDKAQCRAERKVPKRCREGIVHMHFASAFWAYISIDPFEPSMKQIHHFATLVCFDPRSLTVEIRQSVRNHETILHISC